MEVDGSVNAAKGFKAQGMHRNAAHHPYHSALMITSHIIGLRSTGCLSVWQMPYLSACLHMSGGGWWRALVGLTACNRSLSSLFYLKDGIAGSS